MEVRLPKKNVKILQKCVVCAEKAVDGCQYQVKYHPPTTAFPEDKDFSLNFPLCQTHYDVFKKGDKYYHWMLRLFGFSLIPFVVGLLIYQFSEKSVWGIPFFVFALSMSVLGYFLFEIAAKLAEQSTKGKVKIKIVTDSEIILYIENEKWAEEQQRTFR